MIESLFAIGQPTPSACTSFFEGSIAMRILSLTLCFAVLTFAASPSIAVNLSFIPGDAFFSTRLTAKSVAKLPAEGGTLKFGYAYPEGSGDLCGFAGFTQLEVLNANSNFAKNVRAVYRAIRNDYPLQIEVRVDDEGNRTESELNGLQAFVYNRNLDWKKQRLAIKYNEGWFSLPKVALSGSRKKNPFDMTACMQYVSFVPGAEAVAHDWKYAAKFAGLQAKLPDVEGWGVAGPRIMEPVTARADDVRLIVLEDNSIKDAYRQEDDVAFYSISAEGVDYCYWSDDREEGESRFFTTIWNPQD
jgi:hypothetical protein